MGKEAPQNLSRNEIHRRLHGIKKKAVDFAQNVKYKTPLESKRLNESLKRIFVDGASILATSFETGIGTENAAEALGIVLATISSDSSSRQGEYLEAFAGSNLPAMESQISSKDEKVARKVFQLLHGLNSNGLVSSDYFRLAHEHKDALLSMYVSGNKDAGAVLEKFSEDEYGYFPQDVAEVFLKRFAEKKFEINDAALLEKFKCTQLAEFFIPNVAGSIDELEADYKKTQNPNTELKLILTHLFGGEDISKKVKNILKTEFDSFSDTDLVKKLLRFSKIVHKFSTSDFQEVFQGGTKEVSFLHGFLDRVLDMRRNMTLVSSVEYINLFNDSVFRNDPRVKKIKEDMVNTQYADKVFMLDSIGLDGSVLFQEWISAESRSVDAVHNNIQKIERLEKTYPGICIFLQEKYGITHFKRYPDSLLISTYQNHEGSPLPHGVVVVAKDDYNGAMDIGTRLEMLLTQTDGHFITRVVEVRDKLDAAKRLLQLRRKYGNISFIIGVAHGSRDSMTLGSGHITTDNMSVLQNGWRDLFVENPDFIFHSCRTGEEDAIGQTFSRVFDARVTAPVTTNGIKSIAYEDGHFSTEFWRRKGGHIFSAGELVSIT